MKIHRLKTGLVTVGLLWLLPGLLEAAKIGDITDTTWTEQAFRFLSMRDPAVREIVLGSIFLAICCGLLGSFIVVRKLSLVGDALSHAVLPGVALGFLWHGTKDPLAIFIGATVAGLIGVVVMNLLRDTSPVKEDASLGMVLAGFYAAGIVLVTMIQNTPTGNKSGIDKYLFGQAAALSPGDVALLGMVSVLAIGFILLFYKELLAVSFDSGFARAVGIRVRLFHYGLMLLLAFSVVASLQAVGVVLVSAMLIIPAAAAYLLTDRLHVMLLLAALFGAVSGLVGAFFSYLGNDLPTGPFMVLAASVVFATAFLFGPRHGLLPRWWRDRSRVTRIAVENMLKAIYHVREQKEFSEEGVRLSELESWRNESLAEIEVAVQRLLTRDLATIDDPRPGGDDGFTAAKTVHLTPAGWTRACEIVRNHRLWELYLTHAAQYAVDHVHDDAEVIEHVLGDETVRKLERRLDFPRRDPHGKLIPSLLDLESAGVPRGGEGRVSGYAREGGGAA